MGPISAAQMGSVFFCPRARCPPQMGSPSIRIYGLLLGPTSPAHFGCQYRPCVDSPDGLLFCPRARCPPQVGSPSIRIHGLLLGPTSPAHLGCQYGPNVKSPDGLYVLLSARSMSAQSGQPIDPFIWAPSRSHLPSPFGLPIWAPRRQPRWALCYFVRALDVRPKWAAHRSVYIGSF